ncbi:MAG: MalY/PatB family protein [Oscillospiraceae bacterium]
MKYNFDEIIDRHNTRAIKWDVDCNDSALDADALSMWIADMDFACAPPIVSALKKAAERRIFGYSSNDFDEYYSAVTGFFKRRHGWTINPKHIVFTRGIVPALGHIIDALTDVGDNIIIQPPVYPPFARVTTSNRRNIVENPLINDNGYYTMDYDDLAKKAADPKTTMMIMCSPHNPAGRVWSAEEIRAVCKICTENNIILVSDEIHCDITRAGIKHTPTLTLFEDAQNIVVCTAPTKTFNIAGLGASHLVIPNAILREKVERHVGELIINPLTTEAVIAAYSKCDEWVDQMNAYVDENFRFFKEAMNKKLPMAVVSEVEGTYLAWPNISAYCDNAMDFERNALKKANLCIEAGSRFGIQGEGYLRINLACPRKYVSDAVDKMALLCK